MAVRKNEFKYISLFYFYNHARKKKWGNLIFKIFCGYYTKDFNLLRVVTLVILYFILIKNQAIWPGSSMF